MQARVPAPIAAYFGCGSNPAYREFPTIGQFFVPGKGWVREIGRQRVCRSKLTKLRAKGATAVAIDYRGRRADFTMTEALKVDQRPMFGGRLI